MQFIKLNFFSALLFALAIVSTNKVYSEEGGGGHEGGGEAKAEGEQAKSEGGEAKKSEGGGDASDADREWAKRKTRLNILEVKISETETHIKNLLKAQNDGIEVKEEKRGKIHIPDRVQELHGELKKLLADYTKEREELKYRYPEEGMVIERRYLPLRLQTIEELQKELGIQGDMTRLKAKIDKKYEPIVGPKTTDIPQAEQGPESTVKQIDKNGSKQKKRLKLVQ